MAYSPFLPPPIKNPNDPRAQPRMTPAPAPPGPMGGSPMTGNPMAGPQTGTPSPMDADLVAQMQRALQLQMLLGKR